MASNNEEKIRSARELCEKARWEDVLAFAARWQAEDPADAKALFYQGVAQVSLGRLPEAETSYRRSLALDAHGKSLSSALLDMDIEDGLDL